MRIQHHAVTSDIYKLITTMEFDLEVGDHFLPTRIELFQDTERANHFRCRMWERDLYRLRMTAMNDTSDGEDDYESDEELLVERTWELSDEFEDFEAENPEAAMKIFLERLTQYLKEIMG